jgi:hypothetical protein
VAWHVANQNAARRQRFAARVAEGYHKEKQRATRRTNLTSLGTTGSSSIATPCTDTLPGDSASSGGALAPGGGLVHGRAPLIGTGGMVSPTTSIKGTGDGAPSIDDDMGMLVLDPSVNLLQELVPSLSTTAINQADGEFPENIPDAVDLPDDNEIKVQDAAVSTGADDESNIEDVNPPTRSPRDNDNQLPLLCPHHGRKTSSEEAANSAILMFTQNMKSMIRAITTLTQQISETNKKLERMQEESSRMANKTLHNMNLLTKRVANDVNRMMKMSNRVDKRVQVVEANQVKLRKDIASLQKLEAKDTEDWVDTINTMMVVCDGLWEDVNVLLQKMDVQPRPAAINTPYVASTTSHMDIRNQSSTSQPTHCGTRWAPHSTVIPDTVRTHVPVNQCTFDSRYATLNAMPQSSSNIDTPRALDRLLDGLLEGVRWWHGGGDIVQAVDGC